MTAEGIEVVYRVRACESQIEARVDGILLEQTVEVPRRALTDPFVLRTTVGRVLSIEVETGGTHLATLEQPTATAAGDPAQLLNVLFGNSSLQSDVELVDVRLPPALAAALGGPRFGLAGLRSLTGVEGRALTCSTVKPMGLPPAALATLCRTLALAGLDMIKDDHGLADHAFCPFRERVRACLDATASAAEETGRRATYVPNLMGTPATVLEQAQIAAELGAQAVMVTPMLLGLPFLAELAQRLGMPILGHPALGGATRIAPRALFGVLFPAYGADAVIFTSFGTRFTYAREECAALAAELRAPRAPIRPALPVPAGGIEVERVEEILDFYGPDTMLLVGGSVLEAGDRLPARARELVERVRAHASVP